MRWWRRHWRWLIAGAVAFLGLALVLCLYLARRRAEAERLAAELAFMKAGAKVEGLKAERSVRARRLLSNKKEREALDGEIREAKRVAVAAVKSVEGMSDYDIAAEFKRMGY
jgi:C4-dicarboxylate-specific signal transduction histidine kinase